MSTNLVDFIEVVNTDLERRLESDRIVVRSGLTVMRPEALDSSDQVRLITSQYRSMNPASIGRIRAVQYESHCDACRLVSH